MKRPDPFFSADVPHAAFEEMKTNAIEVFERNLVKGWPRSMDFAIGATYLDGFLTGALFVMKGMK